MTSLRPSPSAIHPLPILPVILFAGSARGYRSSPVRCLGRILFRTYPFRAPSPTHRERRADRVIQFLHVTPLKKKPRANGAFRVSVASDDLSRFQTCNERGFLCALSESEFGLRRFG